MSDPRFEPVQAILNSGNLDAAAFVPGPNFRRIFGQDFHLMERPLVIILPVAGEPVAIVPKLEMSSFRGLNFPGPVFDWLDETGHAQAFRDAGDALPQLKRARRFGLEAQRMRVFEHMALMQVFPDAVFVDAHAEISTIRLIKSDAEIALLKKAIAISEAALEATLQSVRAGMSEVEVQAGLMRELFANGADGLSFEPIVAAGENSAIPHATARHDYCLQRGDSLLIDFGATWQGYNADITRTFFVDQISDHDREMYETVLKANARGKAIAKAGVSAGAVDDCVQKVLENSRFGEYDRHKTGHGLGLDVHEAPQIMRGNDQILEAGMVFTVEPGLYQPGHCGVRIEDDVVAREGGIDCLTTFPRDLRIVG